MRLVVLTVVVMLAFAGNSILNRLALKGGDIGALAFALWRLGAGAAVLAALSIGLRRGLPLGRRMRWAGAAVLCLYVLGFSYAYLALDAGLGALILFGGVQVTMFAGAIALREPLPARRWLGAGLALGGLAFLLWPGAATAIAPGPALMMAAAALGWGLYSLIGRTAGDPLPATAASFALALPLAAAAALLLPADTTPATTRGIALAIVSGALTSGLGYALWYQVMPQLGAARAAVAQLSVPVIASLGGALLLGEVPGWRYWAASAVILGGVALASRPPRR